jgi:hypothetical protein
MGLRLPRKRPPTLRWPLPFSAPYRPILKTNKPALRNGSMVVATCFEPHQRWVRAEGGARPRKTPSAFSGKAKERVALGSMLARTHRDPHGAVKP